MTEEVVVAVDNPNGERVDDQAFRQMVGSHVAETKMPMKVKLKGYWEREEGIFMRCCSTSQEGGKKKECSRTWYYRPKYNNKDKKVEMVLRSSHQKPATLQHSTWCDWYSSPSTEGLATSLSSLTLQENQQSPEVTGRLNQLQQRVNALQIELETCKRAKEEQDAELATAKTELESVNLLLIQVREKLSGIDVAKYCRLCKFEALEPAPKPSRRSKCAVEGCTQKIQAEETVHICNKCNKCVVCSSCYSRNMS